MPWIVVVCILGVGFIVSTSAGMGSKIEEDIKEKEEK